jgi:hypothetical protein
MMRALSTVALIGALMAATACVPIGLKTQSLPYAAGTAPTAAR